MNLEEIERYIATSSKKLICIYRERITDLDLLVVSYYIMGKPNAYVISVEFDPIDMVDYGEGWIWQTRPMLLTEIVDLLEKHFHNEISQWNNITKSGHLDEYHDDIDSHQYAEQMKVFSDNLQHGKRLLPTNFSWIESS
ncbi:hypothetical protein [Endozoicomonas arenosclerae]|uniref:hypothetical protein n=1 Tax=Endozoicomonas arenosclerae TaxID=1633495 RepID=UPI000785F496|nr:hypothetical protein [Endozoicomonas arenosclerae]